MDFPGSVGSIPFVLLGLLAGRRDRIVASELLDRQQGPAKFGCGGLQRTERAVRAFPIDACQGGSLDSIKIRCDF
jgi:hypothetical protein